METSRRSLLRAGLVAGAATAIPATWWDAGRASAATPALPGTPFTLGVASGDPWPDGFVLWTRLAVEPLAGGSRARSRRARGHRRRPRG